MNEGVLLTIIVSLGISNVLGSIAWFLRYREVQYLMRQKDLAKNPVAMITAPLPQEPRPRGKTPDIFEDVDPEDVPDSMKKMMDKDVEEIFENGDAI